MARWEENWREHAAPLLLGEAAAQRRKSWVLLWSLLLALVVVAVGVGVTLVQAVMARTQINRWAWA